MPVLGLTKLLRGTPTDKQSNAMIDLDLPDDVDFEGMAE
jgi:hypothetical protein